MAFFVSQSVHVTTNRPHNSITSKRWYRPMWSWFRPEHWQNTVYWGILRANRKTKHGVHITYTLSSSCNSERENTVINTQQTFFMLVEHYTAQCSISVKSHFKGCEQKIITWWGGGGAFLSPFTSCPFFHFPSLPLPSLPVFRLFLPFFLCREAPRENAFWCI